ncbi:HipA domain-containing protein [Candidatus Poriferisodalis multihospitum]|uniref:HipA domain-containing protein n=1 Tax=Candidatus Poriferisodalis multihospitum TaxID=2983191 RepID=UPI002B25A030|nr:HipA domain-containing protein [Candidatus Poriferisodalis multihospitum]
MTPAELRVRVGGETAATLERGTDGLSLAYDADYLAWPDAIPLSLSLPLRARPHVGPLVETWLDGLLPDRSVEREEWRRRVGAVSASPFGLLSTPIGSECAGAVQFEGTTAGARRQLGEQPSRRSALEPVSETDLAAVLAEMSEGALLGGWRDDPPASFSLAGTMPKLAVRHGRAPWCKAIGDEPTTHILKPSLPRYPGQAVGEHLALSTARRLGIEAVRTHVALIGGIETLVVERFDRSLRSPGGDIARIHQEDLCQALGLPLGQRFERDGGPGPGDVARLLAMHSSDCSADLRSWFRRLVYCWLIVANDAHAKNHALLHLPGAVCRLAPMYGTESWLPYTGVAASEIDLAMSLGDGYQAGDGARIDDWQQLAREFGMDSQWAAAEVLRIAQHTPAHLEAAIDALGAAARSSDMPTRLLDAVVLRSESVLADA